MPQNSRFQIGGSTPRDPAVGGVAINYTGGDQALTTWGRGLYIGTAGNLSVVMHDGSAVVFSNLAAGVVYQFAVKQINQTGSTAAGVVLL